MKFFLIAIFIMSTLFTYGQPTDTLSDAKAYASNFLQIPLCGIDNNGHYYTAAFKLNYNESNQSQSMDILKIDMTAKVITSKNMPWTLSSTSVYWRYVFDSSKNIYLGLNSGNRTILKLNLNDSIYAENLGNSFMYDVQTLAYVMTLQQNGSIIIGGSSSVAPVVWTEIFSNGTKVMHPEADTENGYAISVLGSNEWAYIQSGQNPFRFIAVRKSDNYKKVLLEQATLMNTGVYTSGNYVQHGNTVYKVEDTTLTVSAFPPSNQAVKFVQVNIDYADQAGKPTVSFYFDPAKNKLFWNLDGAIDSISTETNFQRSDIRRVYANRYDTTKVYYVGDYYGTSYQYDLTNNTRTPLGYIGFNTYCFYQVNDTIIYAAGYPSAQLAKWNINQPWTAETFVNGQVKHISSTTNPQLMGNWRSGSPAGFHHAEKIIRKKNKLISAGNVIRVDNTCSIGTYDMETGVFAGYDYNNISGLGYSDIYCWGDKVIFSTNNAYGGTAKLYIYDPDTNTMEDSIAFGLNDYGRICTVGDQLFGINSGRFYKVNLSTKQVTYNKLSNATINYSYLLADGRIAINAPGITLPKDFYPMVTVPYNNYDGRGFNYFSYNSAGVVRTRNLSDQVISLNQPEAKKKLLEKLLN